MEKPVAGTFWPRKRSIEAVVASAAADRAEAHELAVFVLRLDQEFGFEHGAGVVFEATNDGGIDADTVDAIA